METADVDHLATLGRATALPGRRRRFMAHSFKDMTKGKYSCRSSWLTPSTTFWLEPDGLRWKQGPREGRVTYASVSRARIYKVRFLGSSSTYWRCVLSYGLGPRLRLQAAYRRRLGRIEDRTASYIPFIKELEAKIAAANPDARFLAGRGWFAYLEGAIGAMLVLALRAAGQIEVDWVGAAGAWLMRKLGPWLRGHRLARSNLVAAFPDKPASEIDALLLGMWDNLGRVIAEYGHLDRLWNSNVVLDEDSRRHFLSLCRSSGSFLTVGAHLANWELLIWAAGSPSGESAVVYRAPKIGPLARELTRLRAVSSATLIPADAFAMQKVKAMLARGGAIGLLVDEHSRGGVDVDFFGRTCKVNSALAQFARRFECPIHGVRIVRLQGSRFRFEVTGPILAPRDEAGKIDVAATMQVITSMIEAWIREHPEQWLWFQRRWRSASQN
jgi:KDO2-lipid IV(A) lauroyltransferase